MPHTQISIVQRSNERSAAVRNLVAMAPHAAREENATGGSPASAAGLIGAGSPLLNVSSGCRKQ
ncbi:MAG TPA: hypothetical protein VKQ29_00130 [Aliidongia sp.]|nr:hypothetical protein [Aliidongia sp.]